MKSPDDGNPPMPVSGEAQIDADLSVVEVDDAYLVVVEGDHDDWLVRFERAEDFDAHSWADNMANVYNRRRSGNIDARLSARRPE